MLGHLYESGREAGMVLGEDRRSVRMPRIFIPKIAVAHFAHIGGRQDGLSIMGQYGRTAQGEIDGRIDQGLMADLRSGPLLRQETHRGSRLPPALSPTTPTREPSAPSSAACQPAPQSGETVFEARRKSIERRQAIFNGDDDRVDPGSDVAADVVAHVERAEHPTPAVEVQHKWSVRPPTIHSVHANRHLAGRTGTSSIRDVDPINHGTEEQIRHHVVANARCCIRTRSASLFPESEARLRRNPSARTRRSNFVISHSFQSIGLSRSWRQGPPLTKDISAHRGGAP